MVVLGEMSIMVQWHSFERSAHCSLVWASLVLGVLPTPVSLIELLLHLSHVGGTCMILVLVPALFSGVRNLLFPRLSTDYVTEKRNKWISSGSLICVCIWIRRPTSI